MSIFDTVRALKKRNKALKERLDAIDEKPKKKKKPVAKKPVAKKPAAKPKRKKKKISEAGAYSMYGGRKRVKR